jgi:type IV secretion system protein TrbL
MQRSVFLLCLLLLPAVVFAQPVGPPAPLDLSEGLIVQFEDLRGFWYFALFPAAQSLFWKLAALDVALSAIRWMSASGQMDSLATALFRKILWVSVGYTFLLYANTWMPLIIQSFIQVGGAASGLGELSPGSVFTAGLKIGTTMLYNMAGWGIFTNFLSFLVGFCCTFVVIACYAWMAIELAVTLAEAFLIMGAGVFLLAFSSFSGTAAVAERYFGFILTVGIKLFTLYLIMGTGLILAPAWGAYINEAAMLSYTLPLLIAASTALFAGIVWRSEKLAASIAQGSVNFSAGDVIPGGRGLAHLAATVTAQANIATAAARLAVAASQGAGGGIRGALTGAGSAAQALTQAGVAASVPRLQWAADSINTQARQRGRNP